MSISEWVSSLILTRFVKSEEGGQAVHPVHVSGVENGAKWPMKWPEQSGVLRKCRGAGAT